MKKLSKKLLISATIFTAALNMNGCAYGPPPEDLYMTEPSVIESQSGSESETEVQEAEIGDEGVESAN